MAQDRKTREVRTAALGVTQAVPREIGLHSGNRDWALKAMKQIVKKMLGVLSLPLAYGALFACDSSDEPESTVGTTPPPGSPAGTGGNQPNAGGNGDAEVDIDLGNGVPGQILVGAACTADTECGPLACHPISLTCEGVGAGCATHADCAQGFFCNAATALCLVGKTGSPCDADTNCEGGGSCTGGTCGCAGFVQEQEITEAKLDIYYLFDHTASMVMNDMGQIDESLDCVYTAGTLPPVVSKACSATYAFSDYLLAAPAIDTRLAFQFMSLEASPGELACDGGLYSEPLIDLTQLPLDPSHAMIQAISDTTFDMLGTQIEGALRGIAQYTAANKAPDREMIGVLMTDGDPYGCDESVENLAEIVAAHYASTGIRTFIIGVDGATEANLEQIAVEGGAEPHNDFCGSLTPPCHYWNVGDASGDVLSQALNAIIDQSAPLACEFPLSSIQPAEGKTLDTATINVTFTTPAGGETTIYNVGSAAECPPSEMAWHYDNPDAPTMIQLCASTCEIVGGTENGAEINIAGGCEATVVIPR